MLGEKLDTYLQRYITAMRSRGAPVGLSIIIAVAREILLRHSKPTLDDLQLNLTQEWAKQVLRRAAVDDKRPITAVLACTLTGTSLPVQLIYDGKTEKCHRRVSFPSGWHITHTDNREYNNRLFVLDYQSICGENV